MKLLWDRMENWLEVHAPDVLADLNQGASELEISSLENAVGFALPSDIKESLRISQWSIRSISVAYCRMGITFNRSQFR